MEEKTVPHITDPGSVEMGKEGEELRQKNKDEKENKDE